MVPPVLYINRYVIRFKKSDQCKPVDNCAIFVMTLKLFYNEKNLLPVMHGFMCGDCRMPA